MVVALTQDFTHTVLVTKLTSSTQHYVAPCRVMLCSVLDVTQPVVTNMGDRREAEVCRGENWL